MKLLDLSLLLFLYLVGYGTGTRRGSAVAIGITNPEFLSEQGKEIVVSNR